MCKEKHNVIKKKRKVYKMAKYALVNLSLIRKKQSMLLKHTDSPLKKSSERSDHERRLC